MAVIPETFTKPQPAIASYDFFDIARQTGYITFYGSLVKDSSGTKYTLNENTFKVHQDDDTNLDTIGATRVMANTNTTMQFDLKFTKSFLLDGLSFMQCAFQVSSNFTSAETFTGTLTYKLYHVDTTPTATQIGSTITQSTSSPGNQVTRYSGFLAEIDIDNQLFKKDEILRVEINLAAGTSSNGNSRCYLYHDPTEAASVGTSILSSAVKFFAPVKLVTTS